MSAPSGVKVPPTLVSAFAEAHANADDVRALVFVVEGDSFQHLTTVKPQGSYADDIALLPDTLPSSKTPASFAYRLDSRVGGAYEWMMVTFVPDDAGVRAKMLQASSRAGLMKGLGANNFKHDWFATSVNDLQPAALKSHLDHILSPPPLTASEAALIEIRAAEKEEAKRVAQDGEIAAARRRAVVGLGGKTKWDADVMDAITKVAQRSDDGWIVTVEISTTDQSKIQLLRSEGCKPGEVASKLPEKNPCYVFYSYPTPPPPKPTPKPKPAAAEPAVSRDTFQATAGGKRFVPASNAPRYDAEETQGESKGQSETADGGNEAVEEKEKAEETVGGGVVTDEPEETNEEKESTPEIANLNIEREVAPEPEEEPEAEPEVESKGRVVFIYWCPSGSPVRYRMVYSTTVRGVQQDAIDKAGVDIVAKLETSDKSDVAERHLKDAVPSKPKHSSSLPTPSSSSFSRPQPVFGAPAPAGAFGRAAPEHTAPAPVRSFATPGTAPVFGAPRPMPPRASSHTPPSAASRPTPPPAAAGDDDEDSGARIQNAFNAFGPRVNAGGGGGFARPRPAGRR